MVNNKNEEKRATAIESRKLYNKSIQNDLKSDKQLADAVKVSSDLVRINGSLNFCKHYLTASIISLRRTSHLLKQTYFTSQFAYFDRQLAFVTAILEGANDTIENLRIRNNQMASCNNALITELEKQQNNPEEE